MEVLCMDANSTNSNNSTDGQIQKIIYNTTCIIGNLSDLDSG